MLFKNIVFKCSNNILPDKQIRVEVFFKKQGGNKNTQFLAVHTHKNTELNTKL